MSNENEPRDTHFANAAKLLMRALMDGFDEHLPPSEWRSEIERDEQIITQFAYDLVEHVLSHTELDTHPYHPSSAWHADDIPDLTEWPETPTPRLLDRSTWPTISQDALKDE